MKVKSLRCARLLHPWDFPGKSTGGGCHCLLQSNSQKQKLKWWLSGAGKSLFNGEGVSVLQEVLEMGLHNNVNVLNTTERVHLKKGYDGNSSLMWISAQLWASLVAQSVKCLPAVQETWV